jgi:hypothetical protein
MMLLRMMYFGNNRNCGAAAVVNKVGAFSRRLKEKRN